MKSNKVTKENFINVKDLYKSSPISRKSKLSNKNIFFVKNWNELAYTKENKCNSISPHHKYNESFFISNKSPTSLNYYLYKQNFQSFIRPYSNFRKTMLKNQDMDKNAEILDCISLSKGPNSLFGSGDQCEISLPRIPKVKIRLKAKKKEVQSVKDRYQIV
jgi:hypothetical protein